ncbi:hypothetical protein [Rickettsia endosymbiont of Urophora cardui]|uniref:hypothetical protein n=1 Tax=Rickettsia endosymbiont of Urophora cardui TaxID=3066265 RepID=UPI00313CE222
MADGLGILMQKIKKYNQIISAAKVGMSVKTARKYLRINKYPSELRTIRKYSRSFALSKVANQLKAI